MPEETDALDLYLLGLPLSDEHAALMEGREPAAEWNFKSETWTKTGPVTEEEKDWLRRLVHEPGFQILIKLLNSSVQNREDATKLLSLEDPYGNRDKILNQWAYISCFRAIMADIHSIVMKATMK